MVQHSSEHALSDVEFSELLESTQDIRHPFDVQCRFVLIAAGRLGLRAGEICHFREDWVDWDQEIIHIPARDPCDFGRDGQVCGYCRDRAAEAAQTNPDLSIQDAMDQRWNPKTSNSVRAVPFGFDEDVAEFVREFTFCYDRWPASRSAVNRRVDRTLEAAGMKTDRAYPHSLRATAATFHAYRGLPPTALQSLFGWSQLQVAQKYIRMSGGRTAEALHEVHSD